MTTPRTSFPWANHPELNFVSIHVLTELERLMPSTRHTTQQAINVILSHGFSDADAQLIFNHWQHKSKNRLPDTVLDSLWQEACTPDEVSSTALHPLPTSPDDDEMETHRNAPKPTKEMLYGLFGDIGLVAAENTEVNPYAACMAAMVFMSACAGRDPYFYIGNTPHHVRLFGLHVGRSSCGRKGDSLGLLKRIIEVIKRKHDPLLPHIHTGGLSTREGVAKLIHDGYTQGKDTIAPIHDKRLWIVESEFANVLHQARREGNTLSAAIRDIFDGIGIKPATKTQGIWASDPHVAISGACTPSELLDLMRERELSNGFANRFIIFWAERTRLEPFPQPTSQNLVDDLARRVYEVIEFAKGSYGWDSDPLRNNQNNRHIIFSDAAKKRYAELYLTELNQQTDGEHIASLMARSPAYVQRMAALFALSDFTTIIEPHHLEAAMAWVRYWRESVKFIFNDAKTEQKQVKVNNHAEKLYSWLTTWGKPASLTQINNDCFKKHVSKTEISHAIELLLTDTPPRIEVIEGELSANGKRPKLYKACGLGGIGGVDCGTMKNPSPQPCGVGGLGMNHQQPLTTTQNPSPPSPQTCGLAETLAAQATPPSPPTPQGFNTPLVRNTQIDLFGEV